MSDVINYALRNLYREVLKEGLKVRVVDSGFLGEGAKGIDGDCVELETYTERGYWIFKSQWPRHRYYLYPDGRGRMLDIYLS